MSELIAQTARLVPYAKRPKQASGFVTAYYYEPMAADPGFDRGNLYAVIEVLVSGRASEEVANLIIDTIGEYYYNQPDEAHTSPTTRFEGAIRAANQELAGHVNRGNAAWIGKLSAVVAVQLADELHVAQSGSGEAFLYRGSSHTRITTTAPNRPASPSKTFGSIASGQLEIGDRILLATPALIHQVPLTRLQSIVGQANPNTAIGEIRELLHGVATERIATLVIEITTPELAALRVRSEQPNEIQLGSPENPLDSARHAAAPLARNTVDSTKKVADVARSNWLRLKPRLRTGGLKLAERIRNLLTTRRGRLAALCVLMLALLTGAGFGWHAHASNTKTRQLQTYQDAYTKYQHGTQLLASGQATTAQSDFEAARQQLASLEKDNATVDRELAAAKTITTGEPRSVSTLNTLITNQLNEIAGLTVVNATTIASIGSSQSQLKHFEIYQDKAYIFDATNNNQLSIVDLASGSTVTSKANTSELGVVEDTTISGSNTGIYILTNEPSIWFYSFATGALIKEPASSAGWPSAQAIGSYGSNIYLLVNGTIIKYTKTAAGYSSGLPEITSATSMPATALAVDGSIYVASGAGLDRYFGGQLTSSAVLPAGVTKLTGLRSTDNAGLIIGTGATTGRIVAWSVGVSGLNFKSQFALNNVSTIYAATFNPANSSVYVSVPGKLLSFPYRPSL